MGSLAPVILLLPQPGLSRDTDEESAGRGGSSAPDLSSLRSRGGDHLWQWLCPSFLLGMLAESAWLGVPNARVGLPPLPPARCPEGADDLVAERLWPRTGTGDYS